MLVYSQEGIKVGPKKEGRARDNMKTMIKMNETG